MKWIKRIIIATVVLLVLGLIAGGVLWALSRGRPDWYPAKVLDAASIRAAADSAVQKFTGVQEWTARSNAVERRRISGTTGPFDPDGEPAPKKVIALTEVELNAFFKQWDDQLRWGDKYNQFISDPVLVLQDNRIILAGTIKETGTLMSVHFEPRLDEQGMLHLTLARVMGGKLPLPRAFWEDYRQKLSEAMAAKVEQTRRAARMEPDGTSNKDAIANAMNRLLFSSLNDAPADPVLFLPHGFNNPERTGFPVKITDVSVADKTITLTVVPLSAEEREQLLKHLREPYPSSASPVAATATHERESMDSRSQ